jgi:hypothetical protein
LLPHWWVAWVATGCPAARWSNPHQRRPLAETARRTGRPTTAERMAGGRAAVEAVGRQKTRLRTAVERQQRLPPPPPGGDEGRMRRDWEERGPAERAKSEV